MVSYREIEEEALCKIGKLCIDFHERTPAHTQFSSIYSAFMGLAEINPWADAKSPFATNTSSILCLPLEYYRKLRILQRELEQFLDAAEYEFDEKIYGFVEPDKTEADG